VGKFGDEDRYELAHEVMVDHVRQWVGKVDLRLLDVHDMLRRDMSACDKFGHLLEARKLDQSAGQAQRASGRLNNGRHRVQLHARLAGRAQKHGAHHLAPDDEAARQPKGYGLW
jgi:hypothetical protein